MNPAPVSGSSMRPITCIVLAMICLLCSCSKNGVRYYKLGNIQLFNADDTAQYPLDALTDSIPAAITVYSCGKKFKNNNTSSDIWTYKPHKVLGKREKEFSYIRWSRLFHGIHSLEINTR